MFIESPKPRQSLFCFDNANVRAKVRQSNAINTKHNFHYSLPMFMRALILHKSAKVIAGILRSACHLVLQDIDGNSTTGGIAGLRGKIAHLR